MKEWNEGDSAVYPALICVFLVGWRRWNSLTSSSACTLSASSHWLSELGYPSHLTRYCSLRPCGVHLHVRLSVGTAQSQFVKRETPLVRVRSKSCQETVRFKNTKLGSLC